ncbi:MAG: hypothetical protein DRO76_02765, partial [Candidatus Altiarchaeales archaeon]
MGFHILSNSPIFHTYFLLEFFIVNRKRGYPERMVEKDNVGMEKSASGRVFGDTSMITTEPAYTNFCEAEIWACR